VIAAIEGASLHLERIRKRAKDFDPAVRDRFIAAAMVPGTLAVKAQKFRRWYQAEVRKLFERVDAILAPATPCTAPEIGQQTFNLAGVDLPVRANLGLYTQPISFVGLPVVAVPIPLEPLPIGIQIITRRGAKTSRCVSPTRWRRWASRPHRDRNSEMETA
jgi:Asp-tRNAAsn/Glu-tRNAGln amidotransferase A subunit and related amidases